MSAKAILIMLLQRFFRVAVTKTLAQIAHMTAHSRRFNANVATAMASIIQVLYGLIIAQILQMMVANLNAVNFRGSD